MAQSKTDRDADVVLDRPRTEPQPKKARARVFVTPEGRVVIGDEVADGEEHMLSEVHPAVFAAPRD